MGRLAYGRPGPTCWRAAYGEPGTARGMPGRCIGRRAFKGVRRPGEIARGVDWAAAYGFGRSLLYVHV